MSKTVVAVKPDNPGGWRVEVRRYVDELPFVVIVAREADARQIAAFYEIGAAADLDRPARSPDPTT